MAQPTQLTPTEQDALVKQIGLAMLRVAPDDWEQLTVDYRAVGRYSESTGQVVYTDGGTEPWTMPADLQGLFARLRGGMYREGRGTWFNARYRLDHPSSYNLEYDREEPTWDLAPPPQAYPDDMRLFPRTDDNVPSWLRRRLASAPPPRFRVARIFDGPGPDGRPSVSRPPLSVDVHDLLDYLDGAPLTGPPRGYDVDRLDPDGRPSVPVAFHTDGTWIWPAAVNYYLRDHDIPPEPELVDHIVRQGFQVPSLDEAVRSAAAAFLGGPGPGPGGPGPGPGVGGPGGPGHGAGPGGPGGPPPRPAPTRALPVPAAATQLVRPPDASGMPPAALPSQGPPGVTVDALRTRLADLNIPASAFHIGPPAGQAWTMDQTDDGWRVGWFDNGFVAPAMFEDVADASAFLLGKLLLDAERWQGQRGAQVPPPMPTVVAPPPRPGPDADPTVFGHRPDADPTVFSHRPDADPTVFGHRPDADPTVFGHRADADPDATAFAEPGFGHDADRPGRRAGANGRPDAAFGMAGPGRPEGQDFGGPDVEPDAYGMPAPEGAGRPGEPGGHGGHSGPEGAGRRGEPGGFGGHGGPEGGPGYRGPDGEPGPFGLPRRGGPEAGRPGFRGPGGERGTFGVPGHDDPDGGDPGFRDPDGEPGAFGLPGPGAPGRRALDGEPGPFGLPGPDAGGPDYRGPDNEPGPFGLPGPDAGGPDRGPGYRGPEGAPFGLPGPDAGGPDRGPGYRGPEGEPGPFGLPGPDAGGPDGRPGYRGPDSEPAFGMSGRGGPEAGEPDGRPGYGGVPGRGPDERPGFRGSDDEPAAFGDHGGPDTGRPGSRGADAEPASSGRRSRTGVGGAAGYEGGRGAEAGHESDRPEPGRRASRSEVGEPAAFGGEPGRGGRHDSEPTVFGMPGLGGPDAGGPDFRGSDGEPVGRRSRSDAGSEAGGAEVGRHGARSDLGREDSEGAAFRTPDADQGAFGGPETPRPQNGRPDFGRPDTGRPDTERADFSRADAERPDFGQPDSGQPDFARADAERADFGRAGAGQSGFGRPDTGRPEFGRPDAGQPDFGRAGAERAGFDQPDAGRPEFGRPGAERGGFDQPNAGQPDFGRPGAERGEFDQPDIGQPEFGRTGAERAGFDQPNAGQPDFGRPGAERGGFDQPDAGPGAFGRADVGRHDRPELEQTQFGRPDFDRAERPESPRGAPLGAGPLRSDVPGTGFDRSEPVRVDAPRPDPGRGRPEPSAAPPANQDWPIGPLPGEPPLTLFRGKRLVELEPGTEIDRFGEDDGNLVYAVGTPFSERSLVPEWVERPYHAYRVRQPVQVLTGAAIPWFEQPGGGTAYLLPDAIGELVALGRLVEISGRDRPRG